MTLIGGGGSGAGGAGNTVNPAGTGTSINYVGNHAYGYSGIIQGTGGQDVLLKFTTGKEYIVGEWAPIYASDASDNGTWFIKIDGQVIWEIIATGATTATFGNVGNRVLLPPYSNIEFLVEIGNNRDVGVTFAGRVYA